MAMLVIVLMVTYVSHAVIAADTLARDTCDISKNLLTIQPDANAMIAGLFDLRTPDAGGLGCGTPNPMALPIYEAVLWALQRINLDSGNINNAPIQDSYIPGMKIGMKVYDTCGQAKLGERAVLDFMPNLYSNKRNCALNKTSLFLGVLGATDSTVTKSVAEFLTQHKVPQISPSATLTPLSDKETYTHFMRTVPPNSVQVKVMVEVLKKLTWQYVALVYTSDTYGEDGRQELIRLAVEAGICVKVALPVKPFEKDPKNLRNIFSQLLKSGTVGVVYLGGHNAAKELMMIGSNVTNAGKLQWLFSDTIGTSIEFAKITTYNRGFLSVSPSSRRTPEFQAHWIGLDENDPPPDNPWYKDWYMSSHNCKLAEVTYAPYASLPSCKSQREPEKRQEYVQNQFVLPAIDAVYTFARGLRDARKAKCNNTRGVCQALADMTTSEFYQKYLRKVDITYGNPERIFSWSSYLEVPYGFAKTTKFDNNGDITDPIYDVWNYRRNGNFGRDLIERVGYYINNALTLDMKNISMYNGQRTTVLNNLPPSPCPLTGCGICLILQGRTRFLIIPGDIIVNGIFSVHRGSGGQACSAVMKNGAQLIEAFAYAIDKMSGFLQGEIKVGALGIDDCNSNTIARGLVTSFHNHMLNIKDNSGFAVEPSNVFSYTAAHSSQTTISIADMLTQLRMTQVGYRATSTALSDKNRFPYFLRTVPSDTKQAMAIVKTLKEQGWSYVQTIQAPTTYGRDGIDAFIKTAEQNGICVTATYELARDGNCDQVIQKVGLRADARVVIVYAEAVEYRCLLEAIKNQRIAGKILLFGSVTWGTSMSIVEGYEDIAVGTFSLSLKTPFLTDFIKYLRSLDVDTYRRNPWFKEWYESMFGCYISAQSQGIYSTSCNITRKIPDSSLFGKKQDPFALYVIDAVYAIVKGIDATLRSLCGNDYTTVCPAFKAENGRSSVLLENITKAEFVDESGKVFRFTDGEGVGEYEINNYQGRTTGYRQLGDYVYKTDQLTLDTLNVKYYMDQPTVSRCTGGAACSICLTRIKTKFLYVPGELLIGALFNIHWTGSSAYTCGKMKDFNGFQFSEAFAHAIDKINSGTAGIELNGVLLGGVGLDDCSSDYLSTNLVSSVHSGSLKLKKDGKVIDYKNIHTWLTYGSYKSLKVNAILSRLNIPQVSPSATSEELQNERVYPTFYRTVPPDSVQAMAMAEFVKSMGWKCAQIVYAPNVYGLSGAVEFQKAAKALQLCLSSCYALESGDGSYDQIVAKLLTSSTKIVIVFANADQYVGRFLDAKAKNSNGKNLVLIGSESWGQLKSITAAGRAAAAENAFTIKIESPVVAEFNTYLQKKFLGSNKRNPWFDEYYQMMFNCVVGKNCTSNTAITSNAKYEQENFVVSTIDAVYATAQAINLTLKDLCGNQSVGICPQFIGSPDVNTKILENLAKVDFISVTNKSFTFDARSGKMGYDISRVVSGRYSKVAEYIDRKVKFTDPAVVNLYKSYPSLCAPCIACKLTQDDKDDEKFTFYPGDLLIAGVFDVSKPGPDPFSCGKVNPKNGFLLTEAFNFALEKIQRREGIFAGKLPGVNLGGISVDSCQSAIRGGNLVADLNAGVITLREGRTTIVPSKILAYVAGLTTLASEEIAKVLNVMNIPHISYGASGLTLAEKKNYPYFLRTVPADDKLARGIVSFLKYWNFEHVQVVASHGLYAEAASDEVIRLARKNGICIEKKIEFEDQNGTATEAGANNVIAVMKKDLHASVIITILEMDFLKTFLKAVDKDPVANSKFFYIGSESWGNDDSILKSGLKSTLLDRVVTFDLETADIPEFDRYLDKKYPSNYNRNPWFRSYYQYVFNCTLPGNVQSYKKTCGSSSMSIPRNTQVYKQDPLTLYVINAVYSIALALDGTLKKICGNDYIGVCEDFRQSGERRLELFNQSLYVNYTDYTFQPFYYEDNGQSSRGYHVYAFKKDFANAKQYYNVGSYNDTHYLKLDITYNPNWYANCSVPAGACDKCPRVGPRLSRYMQWKSQRDVSLVGFFNVHESGNNYLKCGPMRVTYGFQGMLAFFYAIDIINKNYISRFQSTIKVAGLAIDECMSEDRLRQDLFTYLDGRGLCHYAPYTELIRPWTAVAYLTMTSSESIIAGKYFTDRKLVQISPIATSTTLSNKKKFPYFLRISPPDNLQAEAIASILRLYDWGLFMGINTDNDYGNGGMDALRDIANKPNSTLCFGKRKILPLSATLDDAKDALRSLDSLTHAKVVVLFTSVHQNRLILQACRELNLFGRFVWIGSDSWSTDYNIIRGLEEIARGAITLQVHSHVVNGFISWLRELTFTNRKGIPTDWFEEYWQHIHKCRLENSIVVQRQYNRACTRNESMKNVSIGEDPRTLRLIIATFMAAKGVTNIPECLGLEADYCLWRVKREIKHALIYNSINYAQWQVLPDDLKSESFNFRFTEDGHGDIGYVVNNLRYEPTTNTHKYIPVGRWLKGLTMSRSGSFEGYTQGGDRLKEIPSSVCPEKIDCGCPGTAGRAQRFVHVKPAAGKADNFRSVWGVIVTIATVLGFLFTFGLFLYFLFFYPKTGGTTCLGYFLLFGIMFVYAVTLAFVFNPCPTVCCIRQFCLGVSYAICFASMLVKAMNTWRVDSYDDFSEASYKRFSKPTGLFLIALGIAFVQVIIAIEWLTLRHPGSEMVVYMGQYWSRCMPSDFHNEEMLLSIVYVMFLLVLTFIFSALTWRSDENNRESRWILVTCCFVAGIWVLWTIVSTRAQMKYRDGAIAIGNLFSATVMVLCIFIRKIYYLRKFREEVALEKAVLKKQQKIFTMQQS
ncbi:uncharacterized protein LOC141898799 [Tubulanus polymorphus]|uniref:uncharacterized protein LOC141898799 n=1 Tax=Tubulanus polymorphus TaxID=672921 RepID=UPI003DA2AE63